MITSIYPQPQTLSNSHEGKSIRFPEDIQIIIRADKPHSGNLFIGNIEAAENLQILQNLHIKAVVTAAKGQKLKHPKNIIEHTKYLPLEDDDKCELLEFLDEVCDFISIKLKQTNVLVHCIAGVSRSAAIAIAFLMKDRRLSLEDAFNQVKSRRKTICPSENILQQLRKYQAKREPNNLNYSKQVNASAKIYTDSRSNGLSYMKTRTNQGEFNKSFLKAKPNMEEGDISGAKFKTNQGQLNRSTLKTKTCQDQLNKSKGNIYSKILPDDIDEVKSKRSALSHRATDHKINVLAPVGIKNPEESFMSRKSAFKNQPSQLDKSFASSKLNSEQRSEASFVSGRESSVKETKRSQSRSQFAKKMSRVDQLNQKLNEKIEIVQDRFETESKNQKQTLEGELGQLYKLKANLYSQYQSERKAARHKSIHNQTMEDREVKEYILNTLQDHVG